MNHDYIRMLSKDQLRVFKRIIHSGANYLSGTMAPAKSDPETNDIESMDHAMEHYAKRGVKKVVVQPKYMGSRCQLYIHRELDKCYAISRNGYRINHVDLTEIFEERHERHFSKSRLTTPLVVIEDGELMPWSALGEKLIQENFNSYHSIAVRERDALMMSGYASTKAETLNQINLDTKREKALKESVSLVTWSEQLQKFKEQLDLYGKPGKPFFSPFGILKVVDDDGEEYQYINEPVQGWWLSCGDYHNCIVVDPNKWQTNESLHAFLEKISKDDMEGVVVRPSDWKVQENQYAPYLKVRNPDYLCIVYGPDYREEEKLTELVKKKSIGRKVGASIKEYKLGLKLLDIPFKMINPHNEEYKQLVAQSLLQLEKDKELDPRL